MSCCTVGCCGPGSYCCGHTVPHVHAEEAGSRGYLKYVDDLIGDVALGVIELLHKPIGFPARCMHCNMTWPCDRRSRADEMRARWEVSDD